MSHPNHSNPDNDEWNVMRKCPDERNGAKHCDLVKTDDKGRRCCTHPFVPMKDKMPDNLPRCFFRKGDE